jgi:hypothetical protein
MEKVILSKRFDLIEKVMQTQWLHQKIDEYFCIKSFINESLEMYLTKKNN